MTAKEARRLRLKEIQKKYGTLKNFAREARPDAKYFDKYLSQVLTGSRGMGNNVARLIEQHERKPKGWMDRVGASSIEAGELLKIWGQFEPEEQLRIVEELRIRLRVQKDRAYMDRQSSDEIPPKHIKN